MTDDDATMTPPLKPRHNMNVSNNEGSPMSVASQILEQKHPHLMAELITLFCLGSLEKRPWRSFLLQLIAMTETDFAAMFSTTTYDAPLGVTQYWTRHKRQPDQTSLAAAPPTDALPIALSFPQLMQRYRIGEMLALPLAGHSIFCCIGLVKGTFSGRASELLTEMEPHLSRALGHLGQRPSHCVAERSRFDR